MSYIFYAGDDVKSLYYRLGKMRDSTFTRALIAPGLGEWIRQNKESLFCQQKIDVPLFDLSVQYVRNALNNGSFYQFPYKIRRAITCALNAMSNDLYGDNKAWRERIK